MCMADIRVRPNITNRVERKLRTKRETKIKARELESNVRVNVG